MRILAVDTAAKSCSIAIIDNNRLLAEITLLGGETHSKHLMKMIDQVFHLSGYLLPDMDGLAVTKGPGSFTGLRIGISSIKGLALASRKPTVGVSTLDALAFQIPPTTRLICPILDARKGEVYFSQYRYQKGGLKKEIAEQVATPQKATAEIKEPCLFVGDGAAIYQKVIQEETGDFSCFLPPGQNILRASTVAHLSVDRFEKNRTDPIDRLVPSYIRKPDADLGSGKKTLNGESDIPLRSQEGSAGPLGAFPLTTPFDSDNTPR